jgi:hypothetical protein
MKLRIVFRCLPLVALFLALAPTALASTTWYVDGVKGSDSNGCKSPQHACKTITHAISLASSGDSIMVAAATYTENLTIGFSLKIVGSGAKTTIIDGGGINTVVAISTASAHVSLSKMTIRNGIAATGGGINNSGRLTISDITVSGNSTASGAIGSGAGIYNSGTLKINYTTISGNNADSDGDSGGGIYNSGTLTINNSTISGNSAVGIEAEGGGISNGGTLTISNTTIGGNIANSDVVNDGGGISNGGTLTINNTTISGNMAFGVLEAGGGGISNFGTLTISTATISGNSTASENGSSCGGGIDGGGTLTINSSTISGNSAGSCDGGPGGGGIAISGTATLQNTIVANNPSGGNCRGGTMTSNGYNLSSDNTCNFNNTGDMNNTEPKLGRLRNNGGPTRTHALLSGSPAIDAGNPNGCTDSKGHLLKTDQRGKPRPDKEDSGGCDMGAFERQSD